MLFSVSVKRTTFLRSLVTTSKSFKMGVDHKLIKAGNGVDYPKNGDTVAIDYTGTLYDPNSTDEYKRGKQ